MRVQGFANNEIRITNRSKTLKAKSYGDSIPQKRQNRWAELTAFLEWLTIAEKNPGWQDGYQPKTLAHVTHDGHCYLYSTETNERIATFTIEEARNKARSALVIDDELQVTPKSDREIGTDNPQTRFTRKARHTVLEAGAVIQRLCPPAVDDFVQYQGEVAANAVAVTLTLPGSTPEAIRALANYSTWLINCLNQFIRDSGKETLTFYVAELQKRGAIHYHYCLAASSDEMRMAQLIEMGNKLTERWFELLKRMATTDEIKRGNRKGRLPGIDMFERSKKAVYYRPGPTTWRDSPEKWHSYVQPIKKNVASYFSKYTSKNVNAAKYQGATEAYSPSRWWGCNQAVRSAIKEWRFDYEVPINLETNEDAKELLNDILVAYPTIDRYGYSFEHIVEDIRVPLVESSRYMVCNGFTDIYFFDPKEFEDVHIVFKELRHILYRLSDITYLVERADAARVLSSA